MKKLFFVFLCLAVFSIAFCAEQQKSTGLSALIDFLNKFDFQDEWKYPGTILDLEKDLKELDENQVAVYALGMFLYEYYYYNFDFPFFRLSKFLHDSNKQLFRRLSGILMGIEDRAWGDTTNIKKYVQELQNSEDVSALINRFWDTFKKDPLCQEYAYLVSKDDKPWDAIRKIWAAKNNSTGNKLPPFIYDAYELFVADFFDSAMEPVIKKYEQEIKKIFLVSNQEAEAEAVRYSASERDAILVKYREPLFGLLIKWRKEDTVKSQAHIQAQEKLQQQIDPQGTRPQSRRREQLQHNIALDDQLPKNPDPNIGKNRLREDMERVKALKFDGNKKRFALEMAARVAIPQFLIYYLNKKNLGQPLTRTRKLGMILGTNALASTAMIARKGRNMTGRDVWYQIVNAHLGTLLPVLATAAKDKWFRR